MDAAVAELVSQGHIYFVLILIVVGVFGGYVAGLFGIGGGVVLVPTFVTLFPYFGTSHAVLMHAAVGTCLALIVPGALMSTRKQHQQGNLDLGVLRSWLPAVCVGIVVGALLMGAIPTTVLKVFFVAFLLFSTIYALVEKNGSDTEGGLPPAGPPDQQRLLHDRPV